METNQRSIFGKLADGTEIGSYILENSQGSKMEVPEYGATIRSLLLPSKLGLIDIVLGFDSVEDYIESRKLPAPPHFGAVIGRFAGRIKDARFSLNGVEHRLNANNGNNTLHGGPKGFDKVVWRVINCSRNSIELQYVSPSGDENSPGELTVTVKYTLTDANEVVIEYHAVADEDTIINLTQHSYFNLDGHQGNVTSQELYVNADTLLEIDEHNIPSGKLIPTTDKDFDFNEPRKCPSFIDESFVVANTSEPVAKLKSDRSGLLMTVFSDQPTVHIYIGGDLFGTLQGKNGQAYHRHSGICFESQNYTDAPNHPNFPTSVLKKGENYSQKTIWRFESL